MPIMAEVRLCGGVRWVQLLPDRRLM